MIIQFVMLAMLLLPAVAMAQPQQQPPAQMYTADGAPKSDPTALTTQAQKDATAALRELLEAKITAVRDEVLRITDTLNKADVRQQQRLDDVPAQIATQIALLQRLTEEKFKGVDQQFAGRDVALAAALLAQKTSVDEQNKANAASSAKAEGATTKQIDGIGAIITANAKSTADNIDNVRALLASQVTELRNAVTDLRTTTAAASSRGAGQSDLWAYLVGGAGLLLAFFGFARSWMHNAQQQSPPPNWYPPPQYQQPQYQPQYQQPPPQPPQVSVVPVVPVAVPAK